MERRAPILWSGFGATVANGFHGDSRFFGLALMLFVGAALIEAFR